MTIGFFCKVGVSFWKCETYRDESGLAVTIQTLDDDSAKGFKSHFGNEDAKPIFNCRLHFDCPDRKGSRLFNNDHTKGFFGSESENLKVSDW